MSLNVSEYIRLQLLDESGNIKTENKDLPLKKLAQNIIYSNEEIRIKYKDRLKTLTKHISKVLKSRVVVTNKNIPKKIETPYKIIGDKHYFYPIKGQFSLPNELVDKLFYSFSKHGLNYSTTQMLNTFNLEPWQWHAIKNSLNLYKLSNIFSNHTTSSTEPELMKEMVREKLDERINTLGFIVEDEYNKSIIKKYKDVIRQSKFKELEINTIITELYDLVPKVQIVQTPNFINKFDEDHIVAVISDVHFGLSNENDKDSPKFSIDIAKQKLNDIADEINSLNAKNVHIFNLGDVIETFQGNNHVGSWKGIESGYYGSRLVIECYQLFVNFLLKINNLKSYNQLPGNHDRSSSDNKEDKEGFISKIVFEFIRISLQDNNIEFNYEDLILSKNIGTINFLATHGHLGISKTEASELILEYAENPKQFTVLLQGHLHTRRVKKDHRMFRDIIVPALMPGNNYSVTAGFSSNPGFLIIKERKNKPVVIDYSI